MAERITFNPLEGEFDVVDDDVRVVPTAPDTGATGTFYIDASTPTDVYYFQGGDRYILTGVLDNPAASFLLQENGDFLLQENGDKIILE